jgi:hypothetical protein
VTSPAHDRIAQVTKVNRQSSGENRAKYSAKYLAKYSNVAWCAGFRMPAVNDRAKCAVPASESRQRTNPRVMLAEGAAHSAMGIWVTRKVGATDRNALEGEQRCAWWEAKAGVDG